MDRTSSSSQRGLHRSEAAHTVLISKPEDTGQQSNVCNILHRLCYQCGDEETLEHLGDLLCFEPISIKEDEYCTSCDMRNCPAYNDLRNQLSETTKTSLFNDDLTSLFEDRRMVEDIAKMFVRVDARRFPKKEWT